MGGFFKRNHGYSKEDVSSLNIGKKLHSALVEYTYNQALIGFISSFICAVIIVIGIFRITSKLVIFSWLLFFLLVMAIRYLLVKAYQNRENQANDSYRWAKWFVWGAGFAGLSWGMVGIWLMPTASGLTQVFVILVMTGVAAGAVPLFSGIKVSAVVFLVPCILPVIVRLWLLNQSVYFLLGITMLLFLFYLITLSSKFHNILINAISLRYENEKLVENLLLAKHQLEIMNEKLFVTNKQLEDSAMHDPLTKVANRTLLMFELQNAMKRADRHNSHLGVVYLDLDGFKTINDTYGHQIGDELLVAMTLRIRQTIRKNDFVGRLGGDEFVLILEDVKDPEGLIVLVESVRLKLAEPVIVGKFTLQVSVSIGISLYPDDAKDIETLIQTADHAMYRAKRKSRNTFRFYNESLN